jgi:hypothetical protein
MKKQKIFDTVMQLSMLPQQAFYRLDQTDRVFI